MIESMQTAASHLPMARVLLVDDDVELASMLVEYLERDGMRAEAVHDGETGVARALEGGCDIVVLDVMMPGIGGVEALRRIRAQSRLPVMMLTARGDDVDRIVGLELGADDYVPKPCTPRELAARVRAILRRVQAGEGSAADGPVVAGPLRLWPAARRAEWHGRPLPLTSSEFSLLHVLARHAGQVVGKAELSEEALGRPLARFDRSIDVHVSSLRQKLGARSDGSSWIGTVRGRGYQLVRDPDHAR
jgi:DNA-binding response OmpR family regulator